MRSLSYSLIKISWFICLLVSSVIVFTQMRVFAQNEAQSAAIPIEPSCNIITVFGDSVVKPCVTVPELAATKFENFKCYKVQYDSTGKPSNISEGNCQTPPFSGDARTVRCGDDKLVTGRDDQTKKQICKDHAGVYQASTAPELKDIVESERGKILDCDGRNGNLQNCFAQNPIVGLVQVAVNFLAAGAGIIITVMIVIGGIQYSAAGSDPQKVAAAKQRIINAVIALFCLIFLYSFLQWLVPGGVF